ncbi:isochorismatase family protein [Rosistilla carotiformis]|nr:isochorismatase family protein [Rosistilla carotiformis]
MDPTFRSSRLIDRTGSGLLVVDLQTKLLPGIDGSPQIIANTDRLCRAAELLSVPRTATVQYPQGLGPLASPLAERFPTPDEKLAFSGAGCESIAQLTAAHGLSQWIVVGIETHICVLQTTLDLLARQIDVFVVADAVGARGARDHQIALDRMQSEGATLVTTESVLFEWCQTAADPNFKQISAIVREG